MWKLLSHVRLFVTPWTVVHGILQPRILEWVAFPFSRGFSHPRDRTQVSRIAGRFFTSWATREAQESLSLLQWIFPTQESNQGLWHCRQILYQLSYEGNQECSNYHTIVLISHASKVMLKILQARLQQYMNCRIPNVQAGFRDLEKVEEPEIKLSLKKHESCRKTSTSALLTVPNLWLCGSQQTVENSERDRNTRPPDLPPEKSLCRSRSNS